MGVHSTVLCRTHKGNEGFDASYRRDETNHSVLSKQLFKDDLSVLVFMSLDGLVVGFINLREFSVFLIEHGVLGKVTNSAREV